ncbi:MAG: Ig-like domain-containing protein, partial [Vicinamibacteria bacterium]
MTRVDTGLPGITLDGIKQEGRYALLRLVGPVGFIKGLTTAAGSAVRALVSTSILPFIATSNAAGYYAIPGVPGSNIITARVLGQSLLGAAQAIAIDGTPVTADIALQGTVSQATIKPISGAIAVEVNEPLSLTSPVAINPATIQPTNISLRRVPPAPCAEPTPPSALNCAATQVPIRFVLSGSGKQLAIIPFVPPTTPPTVPTPPALEFSTNYTLQITGLLDTVGGLITAPTTTFRTKDDVKPVYNLKAITFSLPDQDGMVSVSAPNGTLPPGTTILIINGGNGVVVGLTAGNDGQVAGTLPASIDDQLFVAVTDPFGNTTTFTRSEFVGADGATGIGPGGGTVKARCLIPATPERDATECAKSAIEIPEGALDKGITLKATVLTPQDYDAAHPDQRPDFGTLAQVIRLEASRATGFNKEGHVTFAVPTLSDGTAPRDAFYYVVQRVERGQKPDGTPDYGFQVIDHAFVICPGETPGHPATPPATCDPSEQRVTTASFPFPGLLAAGLIVVAGALLVRAYADLMLIYAVSPLALGRSPRGVVSGTVRRQVWEGPENGAKKLVYKNVEGAEVSGFDTDGVTPLMTKERGLSVVTGKDGSFAFWDDSFAGGTVKVIVKTATETREVLAVESASADLTGLRHYDRAATVNVTLDPEALPPPTPDVEVVLLRASDRADLRGITLAGTAVLIGFKNNRTDTAFLIQGVNVGGAQFPVVADPLGKYEAIQQPGTPFVPSIPGTFVVETTALDASGIPTPVRAAFRALAPGGGVDTDQNAAPAVIAARTTPRNNALGVAVSTLPSVAFTEPVTHIAGNVTLKATTATGTEDVPIKISGITTQNGVIDDLGANPNAVVTAITIMPLAGLLFGTKYTLYLGAGIEDLDKDATNQPSPKNLTPYSTAFTTFGPETITPEATGDFGARGMYVFGQKAYVLKHQIQGYAWNGLINRYDISDPAAPQDEGLQAILQGRPSHLVGEEASVAAVVGTSFKPMPSTAHLYSINADGGLDENALISFANGGSEGNVERLVLKGEKLYAATFRKGLQVADLN